MISINKNINDYLFYSKEWHNIKLIYLNNLIDYWIILGVLVGIVLIHIISLITNKLIKGNLESIFQTEILSTDEVIQLQKHSNRRYMIIFFTILAINLTIFFLLFIFFKVERRKINLLSSFKKKS
ncbi:hypothetical protein [Mycoplasma capricolum]|uniref:hypothetical protein n=1 Tax=Mycoplasma capricolum TaxID=2095 RepID=UPI0022F3F709|nr:hypothetical protein [Mycoplasma capricolum]WBX36098.1 hypothetical protein NO343_04025 [Mycoplasma capricolum subsp. capricolum]